ncbi:hypothetical protein M5E06_21075 [Azospirillum sp. A1-3]|uniref:hypothetical protein n=1 Tax=Azospirillum sp. A1-3 TaxID=185874 RepID=UPI002076E841|nr:hypothetical protein [Azospirillum sp. A1-3]MCM8736623.1 hypothetical protein [Azospirillum sp. A1-3]
MDPISYGMALKAQQEAQRLRDSLLNVIQAVSAVAQAVEGLQTDDASGAKEKIATAHSSLIAALDDLLSGEGGRNGEQR